MGREITSFHVISGLFLGHITRSIRFQLILLRLPCTFPRYDMYDYGRNFRALVLLGKWGGRLVFLDGRGRSLELYAYYGLWESESWRWNHGIESWHCRLALVSWGHDTYERELKAGGGLVIKEPCTYSWRHTSPILHHLPPEPFSPQAFGSGASPSIDRNDIKLHNSAMHRNAVAAERPQRHNSRSV
jgi:hypothetical protein